LVFAQINLLDSLALKLELFTGYEVNDFFEWEKYPFGYSSYSVGLISYDILNDSGKVYTLKILMFHSSVDAICKIRRDIWAASFAGA